MIASVVDIDAETLAGYYADYVDGSGNTVLAFPALPFFVVPLSVAVWSGCSPALHIPRPETAGRWFGRQSGA